MRLHRFFIAEKIGEQENITLTDFELIHQMVNVFRFQIGDKVILFDGSGFEYETEIIFISKKEIKFNILVKIPGKEILNKNNVCLYLSLIKKNNFELAAEKCTEIGVSEIQPIISERSGKKGLNLERINKIVTEASEQSGRVTLPKVFDILSLENAVSQAVRDGKRCVTFHTNTTVTSFKIIQTNSLHLTRTNHSESCLNNFEEEVALFIGPEGGWTDNEIELFKANNFQICSLGHNILRAETAAIVAVWEAFHRE
jgi:16S rRNA (uracil1498-N3)-methyltransferase